MGYWLRCQGASRVKCLWVEPEQVSVLLRWASQEPTEQRLTPLELRALELPRAWAVVWVQTVREQRVLLQIVLARPLQECFVGLPAFVVMLDATRASAR